MRSHVKLMSQKYARSNLHGQVNNNSLSYDEENEFYYDHFLIVYNVPTNISNTSLKQHIIKERSRQNLLVIDMKQHHIKHQWAPLSEYAPEPDTRHIVVYFTSYRMAHRFALFNPEIWIDANTPLLCILHAKKTQDSAALTCGTQDIGDSETCIVLLRGFDCSDVVDEHNLYETVCEQGFSPTRVLLMRSRVNLKSCGYAFIDFNTLEEASQFIRKVGNRQSKSVSLEKEENENDRSYLYRMVFLNATAHSINMRVFKPIESGQPVSYCCTNSAGNYMYYWDLSLYPAEYRNDARLNDSFPNNCQKKFRYESPQQSVDQPPIISGMKNKKFGTTFSNSRSLHKVPEVLKTWQSRQLELRPHSPQKINQNTSLQKSFADSNKKACVLCLRKFKSSHELNSHERMSQLHLYNLTIESKVNEAEKIMSCLLNESEKSK